MSEKIELEKLKYPIGRYQKPAEISRNQIDGWIDEIAAFPSRLKKLTEKLSRQELNWKYRPGGWTVQQVVHHCADSHMNAFIRFKLCLTEDTPTIKPYLEARWAELSDTVDTDISESMKILEGVHMRLVNLLRSLDQKDLKRKFIHPEHGRKISLEENIGLYAWHSNHHLAHIAQAIEGKGKYDNIE